MIDLINSNQAVLMVLIAGFFTFLIRAVPFILFGGKKKMPEKIRQIANKLPPAIIAILVIYCIKDISLYQLDKFIITIVSIIFVILLHLWKREILISIAGGTIIYMILLRM